jgi:phytoene dehydrogenase-like protein
VAATNSTYDVVVVGGGHNGLVTSFYLARAGLRVVVLERREFVGGACATEELFPDHRVSSCSDVCWVLQPKVIQDLELERYGFSYNEPDPVSFNPYPDGSSFFVWPDTARTQEEIAKLNQHDASSLPAWNSFWARAAGLLNPFLLSDPPSPSAVAAHARATGEEELLEQLTTSSIGDICQTYFEDSRIMAQLAHGMLGGDLGDPWLHGGAWVGTYYQCGTFPRSGYAVVNGGMGAITQAMRQAASDKGVEIRTEAEVARILVNDNKAVGVALTTGEEIVASTVVSNADPKRTYLDLLDAASLEEGFRASVEGLSTQISYLKFYAVMSNLPDISRFLDREPTPQEAHFTILAPSLETFRRAYDEARSGIPAREPIVEIEVPTVYDRTLTSASDHVLSVWIPFAPPVLATGTWDTRRQEVGEDLIDYVTEYIPNFRRDITEWTLFTPADIERRVGMTAGNIRHLDMIPGQFLSQRPLAGAGYGTPIEGLFLCGAGTHPGGEVSGAPGHNAAHAILRELGRVS